MPPAVGILFAATAALSVLACGPRTAVYEETRFVMGAAATIRAVAADDATARRAVAAAFGALAASERVSSYHAADSELARVNRGADAGPVVVSEELYGLLARSLALAAATDGYFDPTIAPVVDLYRVKSERPRWPSDAEVAAARPRVGYRGVTLDARRRTVAFARAGMKLDLSAIAAGWAVDRAVVAMKGAGAVAGIVDGGGEVACFGGDGVGRPWRVGIRHPRADGLYGRVEIPEGAVATSGDYEQRFDVDGRKFSHVFDPYSGRPAARAASVTVFRPEATDCATADAWSTALVVMPAAAAAKAFKRPGAPAALILRDEVGKLVEVRSGSFPEIRSVKTPGQKR